MDTKIRTQLERDAVLRSLLARTEWPPILAAHPENIYPDLLVSVLSQQLSAKAAATIHNRFLDLFPGRNPAPQLLRAKSDAELRTAGVSRQKAGYLRNIADRFFRDDLVHADWMNWSDAEILNHLTRIKGVGQWTAQMILIFTLARPDVFPTADQGIQAAMGRCYELPEKGVAKQRAMEEIAEAWRPNRSWACRLLWKALDEDRI